MTILNKLSDRDGFIYEIIKVILVNTGPIPEKRLQFMLLTCGVYVKKPLLEEALKIMKEKGMLSDVPAPPPPEAKQKVMMPLKPKIIMP